MPGVEIEKGDGYLRSCVLYQSDENNSTRNKQKLILQGAT